MTDPKKKEDPVLKGLGTVDQALFDAQAKTIDVVDNVFLGDKRSLDEIKVNRQKIREDYIKKTREAYDEMAKGTVVDDVLRAGASVVPSLINSTNNQVRGFFSSIKGNPYEPEDIIDLEAIRVKREGDEESPAYSITQGLGKFLVPFGVYNKGLKAAGLVNKPLRFFGAGQLTDAFHFSPREENLFDLANRWKPIRNDFFEFCGAADEDVPFLEAKLRQQFCNGLAGEAIGFGLPLAGKGAKAVTDSAINLASGETLKNVDDAIFALKGLRDNPIKRQKALEILSQYQKTSLAEADILNKSNTELLIDEGDETIDQLLSGSKPQKQQLPTLDLLADTRGKGEFYHGAADEFELDASGHFSTDTGIYGQGLYSTDDLTTAGKYQKKNKKIAGKDAKRTIYKVEEKTPIRFYDLDQPLDNKIVDFLRQDTESFADGWVDESLEFIEGEPTLAKLLDSMRKGSQEWNVTRTTFQDYLDDLKVDLGKQGFGGFTHQGGKLAGKGKRLHQVKIYWDPQDQLNINKVDVGGGGDQLVGRGKPPKAQKFPKELQPKTPVGFINQETGEYIPSRKILPEKDKDAQLIYDAINYSDLNDPKAIKTMTDPMQLERVLRMVPETTIDNIEYLYRNYADQTKETLRDYILKGVKVQRRRARNINRYIEILEEAKLTNNEELYNKARDGFARQWIEFNKLVTPLKGLRSEIAGAERVGQLAGDSAKGVDVKGTAKATTKSDQNVLGQIQAEQKLIKKEKALRELIPSPEQIQKALDSKDLTELLDFTRKLRTVGGDANELAKLLTEKGNNQLIEDISFNLRISKEVMVNQLLAAPETQKVNIFTGMINSVLGPLQYLSYAGFEGDPKLIVRGLAELVSHGAVVPDSLRMAKRAWNLNQNIIAPANRKLVGNRSAFKELGEKMKTDPPQAIKDLNIPITKQQIDLPFNKSIAPISITNEFVSDVFKTVGTAVNLPGRFTTSWGDEFVKQQILRSGSFADYLVAGWEAGLKGEQFKTFISRGMAEIDQAMTTQSIDGMSTLSKGIYEKNANQAIERTFTRSLGEGYFKGVTKLAADVLKRPGMDWLNAFVTTPVNIKKYALRHFLTLPTAPFTKYDASKPGNVFQKLSFKTGKPINIGFGNLLKEYNDAMLSDDYATKAKALGEARIGQGFLLTLGLFAKAKDDPNAEIVLVGAGPRNYKAQKVREDNGELPNSIGLLEKDELGNKVYGFDGKPKRYYVQFERLDPWASPFSFMGDYPDITAALDIEDVEEVGNIAIALASRQIKDDTFLKGVTEFMDMWSDPSGDKFARWLARQIMLRTTPGFASVGDIARATGIPEGTVKYLDIATLGVSKIPIPMPQTLARSIKRSQDYEFYDEPTGLTYKLENPKFNRKIRKGDLTKQIEREDGSLKDEDKIPFVEDVFKKFGINFMRELSLGINGWDADLEPVRNVWDGKFQQYPTGFGYKNMNPIKSSESVNNPIFTFMQEIGYRPTPLSDELLGGIYLDSKNWVKINNSIPLIRDEDDVSFQEKLLNYINDSDVQKRLKIINQNPETIDSQRSKTLRDKYIQELRNGWHSIYKAQEEEAILRWLQEEAEESKAAGRGLGKLEAYIKEFEALNNDYTFNLDQN